MDTPIADIVDAGARVSDIASVLGVTRSTVYAAIERARALRGRRPTGLESRPQGQ